MVGCDRQGSTLLVRLTLISRRSLEAADPSIFDLPPRRHVEWKGALTVSRNELSCQQHFDLQCAGSMGESRHL